MSQVLIMMLGADGCFGGPNMLAVKLWCTMLTASLR